MKAVVLEKPKLIEENPLELVDLPIPDPGPGRVLVRVHACGICQGSCPENIPINTIMRYNHYFEAQNREKHAMSKYARLTTRKAERCYLCTGNCESKCPYNVPIQGMLNIAHKELTYLA